MQEDRTRGELAAEIRDLRRRLGDLERQLAEERGSRQSLEDECGLLRRVLGSIQDGISILDRDLRVAYVNPVMERWYRGSPVGQTCYQAYHGRAEACENCPTLRTLVTGVQDREVVPLRRSDGKPGWVEVFTFPVVDGPSGETSGVIEYVRDITERRRAEILLQEAHDALERRVAERTREVEASNRRLQAEIEERKLARRELEESERLHRTILGDISDAVLIADGRGALIYISPSVETLFGYAQQEVARLGRVDALLGPDLFDPSELEHRGELPNLEREVVDRNGRRHVVLVSVKRVAIRGGTVLYTCRDITERKRMEEALREAKESAEVANRAKSRFLANMSHELRTPLNSILGYTHLVLDGIEGPITSEQRSSLVRVERSARHLLQLVDEVLDLSRIEADRVELRSLAFDLRTSLEEVLRECLPAAVRRGLRLTWEVSPEVPGTLVGDPGRLQQVLENLVENAIKFTPAGRVTVRAHPEARHGDEVWVRFTVEDTGIGIPEEKQAAIFESFTQVDPSETRSHQGVGLGLAICARLVPLLGGRLQVRSRPGHGSAFTFTARFER